MSRIADVFTRLKSRDEKALVLFVTAGDPSLEDLPAILDALAEGGADIIEIGLPFSDPIADGPTIQAASQRALDKGTRISEVFTKLQSFQSVPLVLMGYLNTIHRQGLEKFCSVAKSSHADGVIVCDLTPDEADDWCTAAGRASLDTIFLAAPNSTDERLDLVCQRAQGFVYALARTGVTGQSQDVSSEVPGLVSRIRARTDTPVCVGFGISSPDHVKSVCKVADGAIIGSWLVQFLHERWQDGKGRAELVAAVRELKQATHS